MTGMEEEDERRYLVVDDFGGGGDAGDGRKKRTKPEIFVCADGARATTAEREIVEILENF